MYNLLLNLFCIVVVSSAAFAEPVSVVGRQHGQAFTFSHRGQCFAILPNHVSKRDKFSLRSASPEREGAALMTPLRFSKSDFALATVTGPLAKKCLPSWSDLSKDLGRQLPLGGAANLIHIRRSGVKENIAVRLSPITYEHIGISLQNSKSGVLGQGKSGSLLVVNNVPVGIAIELPEYAKAYGAEARVLRMDAMVARLTRYIEGRSSLQNISNVKNSNSPNVDDEIAYEVRDWNVTPLDAENGPENMAIDNAIPFLTPPLKKLLKLDLALLGDTAQSIREIVIVSDLSDGKYTSPKSIGILASSRSNKQRARTLSAKEMSPDGKLRVKIAATKARWIFLRIRSVWEPSKPFRIDRIIVR